jgi:hypothetical protein
MSVTRVQQVEFSRTLTEITSAIRIILERDRGFGKYRYTDVKMDGAVFETTIKPFLYPFLLQTRMTIEAKPEQQKTSVTVKISAQEFIFGDIFNFYNRYIDQFLSSLRSQIGDAS